MRASIVIAIALLALFPFVYLPDVSDASSTTVESERARMHPGTATNTRRHEKRATSSTKESMESLSSKKDRTGVVACAKSM